MPCDVMNSVFMCVMGELMLLLFIVTHELRRPHRVLPSPGAGGLQGSEEIVTWGGKWGKKTEPCVESKM